MASPHKGVLARAQDLRGTGRPRRATTLEMTNGTQTLERVPLNSLAFPGPSVTRNFHAPVVQDAFLSAGSRRGFGRAATSGNEKPDPLVGLVLHAFGGLAQG